MTNNEMALMANIAVDMQDSEVNDVLDKIKKEVEDLKGLKYSTGERVYRDEVIDIIDKYYKGGK